VPPPVSPKRRTHRILAGLLAAGLVAYGAYQSFQPLTVTIEAGLNAGKGSYYDTASQYKKAFEEHGITVVLKERADTVGIIDDVNRDGTGVDIGFTIQAAEGNEYPNIGAAGVSELQPVFIFTNAAMGDVTTLAALQGKRIATPRQGSITHTVAILILKQFGVQPEMVTFVHRDTAAERAAALMNNEADAGFEIVGPSNPNIVRMMAAPNLRLFDMADAKAVARNLGFLRTTELPRGSLDISRLVPAKPVTLLAGPVDVVMRKDINPAVGYILLEAMKTVHHHATLVNDAGVFPLLRDTNIRPHPLAEAYAKSGVPWIYHHLPPRVASIVDEYGAIAIFVVVLKNVIGYLKMIDDLFEKALRLVVGLFSFRRKAGTTEPGPPAPD
jgi:hypothetical protein